MKWWVAGGFTLLAWLPAYPALPEPSNARSPSPIASRGRDGVPRWEYKVTTYNRVAVFGDSDHEMRLLGLLGWELVSTTYDPHARTIVCFYKRPLGLRHTGGVNPRP